MTAERVGGSDLPQVLADIVVLTVLPEEYAAVLDCLDDATLLKGTAGAPNVRAWQRGTLRSRHHGACFSVVVGKTLPTTSYGALATAEAIRCFAPRYVVFVGVAGGLDRDRQQHGDVVIATTVYGYEYGKVDTVGFGPRPNFTYQCDLALVSAADGAIATRARWWRDEDNRGQTPSARTGAIASGDKVIDDPNDPFFAAVRDTAPGLVAVEMEGAGVGAATHDAQASRTIGFLVVRGLSDLPHTKKAGEGPSTRERDDWKPVASKNAARFWAHLVDTAWPVPPDGSTESTTAPVIATAPAAARQAYLAWAATVSEFAERRRFADAGVSQEPLPSLELERVYVEPELETLAWRRDGARREREVATRLEAGGLEEAVARDLREEYLRLTAVEHHAGVTQSGRWSLSRVVARDRVLVVCGEAGMGKTTLLQHLERQAIVDARAAAAAPIPVRFTVASFPERGHMSLGAYALAQLGARWDSVPESQRAALAAAIADPIERGDVVLLVDALDESGAARRAVVAAIDDYVAMHPTARVVVTTRSRAYDFPLRGRVAVWHMAPLDAERRRRFLAQNTSGRIPLATVSRLFEENRRLADLAGNPFFLVLGSLLAQDDLTGIRHRVELYEHAFRCLWRDRDKEAIAARRAIFAHVADAQRADRRWSEPHHRLEARIDAARAAQPAAGEAATQVLRRAVDEAGLLVQESGRELAFFHTSFQEYLAAVHLTRLPVEEVPARLRALRADPDAAEVVVLALGRLAQVLREPELTAEALHTLAAPDDVREAVTGRGLFAAWQAIREGVTADHATTGRVLARLAARAREIPDPDVADTLMLALLFVDPSVVQRDEVLDALVALVEAEHPVPWRARTGALQAIARAAPYVPRAAALCRDVWTRGDHGNLPAEVAVAALIGGADPDEAMLAPLQRALETRSLAPLVEALARDPTRLGLAFRHLAGVAGERDAAVSATLALLALRDDDLVEAALVRHLAHHDALAGKVIAYLADRQDAVLVRVLDCALESSRHAEQLARTVGRELASSDALRRVSSWVLRAPLECADAWVIGLRDKPGQARVALDAALRAALAGRPETAARAAALLTARLRADAPGDVGDRVAAAAPALVARVEGAAACELLRALFAARLSAPAHTLLARLVRTGNLETLQSALRSVGRHDPAVDAIVLGRMVESAAAREHRGVLECAQFLMRASVAPAEVVAALRSVDDTAPAELQTAAALLLGEQGVHEVGVARKLARAVAATPEAREAPRWNRVLGEVVRAGRLRDDVTLRLLVDGFVTGTSEPWRHGGEAVHALLQHDDALFEFVLDALDTAAPARQPEAMRAVCGLLREGIRAQPPDERLLRRFEARYAGSPILFRDLGHLVQGRPSWYRALEIALDDVDRNAEDALCAAQELRPRLAAVPGDRLRARVPAVLRQLLEHEVAHIALKAATELVFLDDRAVHSALQRALAGAPRVATRAAMALFGLGADDDDVVAALRRCLSSDDEWGWYLPELSIAQARLDAADPTVEAGRLTKLVAAAATVSATAAWLLVAQRRDEVVPVLLDWVEGHDDGKRDEAFAMLEWLGAERAPRAVAWRIRELRQRGWIGGQAISAWLWSNAPDALDHIDALVDLLAQERWQPDALRAWLTRGCAEREDWADRLASLAESRGSELAVELALALAATGRLTESLARRAVLAACEGSLGAIRPLLADLLAATEGCEVLAAAWRQRLTEGAVASRIAAATLLLQWETGAPIALRGAIVDALRAGLDHDDLSVRLDALRELDQLGLVDDSVALAARQVLDEPFGEAPTRVIGGDPESRAAWEAQARSIRQGAAERLLAWGRHTDAATRWLADALQAPCPDWAYMPTVDALCALGGHEPALRASLAAWLRDHPVGTIGEDAIIERAQQLGLDAEVLHRWALAALGGDFPSAPQVMTILFGTARPADPRADWFSFGSAPEVAERAQYWAERLANEGIDRDRAARLLATAVGAASATVDRLIAYEIQRPTGEVSADLAELVRRRPGDGFVAELARAFLRRRLADGRAPIDRSDPPGRRGATAS